MSDQNGRKFSGLFQKGQNPVYSKFTHTPTVIPNLKISQINEIEREFEIFLTENNPSVTDKMTRHMSIKYLGLGLLRIDRFWKAIQISWLRRLTTSKSTGHYCTEPRLNHTHSTQ